MEVLEIIEAIKQLSLEEQNLVYLTLSGILDKAGVGEASIEFETKDGRRGCLVAEVSYRQEMGEYER